MEELWNTGLHLPSWIPATEKEQMTARLPGWVSQLQQLQVSLNDNSTFGLPASETYSRSANLAQSN